MEQLAFNFAFPFLDLLHLQQRAMATETRAKGRHPPESAVHLIFERRLQDKIHARAADISIVTQNRCAPAQVVFGESQLFLHRQQNIAPPCMHDPAGSNATIGVDRSVVERIHRLKLLTVELKAGHSKQKYKIVKSDGPEDLVFQSVRTGAPLRDNNVLTRFIKPAGRKLGFGFVNWRSLRTSRATWMIEAGANPKDVQGQMRHSRIQTTLDIYAQFVPESQRRAIEKTSVMIQERITASRAARAGLVN